VHPLEALLFGLVGLCVVIVFLLSIFPLPAHQVFSQVSHLVSYLACTICISCIFIVLSLSLVVTLWIVSSFILLYLV
jgi:hypothetical protein